MNKEFKIVIKKYPDGYVAYPTEIDGIIVAEGDTYYEESAIRFHMETFGIDLLNGINNGVCN